MKKRNKIFLLTLSVTSLLLGVCAVAGANAFASAEPSLGLSAPLSETVKLGEVIEIPEYYAEVKGEPVKAKATVILPDGSIYEGTKFTVTDGGRYVIEYTVDGEVVHTVSTIAVVGAADLFSVNALAEVDGIASYKYTPASMEQDAFSGVAVNIENGAVITYNREINVGALTKDDLFFEAIVEPHEVGKADFTQMVLTLTDVEDSNSYVKFTLTDGNADGASPKSGCYVNGAANGQSAGGYEYGSKGTRWLQVDIYGTYMISSFSAETMNGYSAYTMRLFYDAEENALYSRYAENIQYLVADFDDPVIFGGNVWDGFKSGRANLSISFTEVQSQGGRVIFNEIAGIRLTQDEIKDDVAPTLTIDMGNEGSAPHALLGMEYEVFPCDVYDFFDVNVKATASVQYENNFTGETVDVMVKDGKFVTDKLGKYVVRYTAVDYSGNTSVKEIPIECIAYADDIDLTNVPEDFTANIFETVQIPKTSEIRAFGGIGKLTVTASLLDPDGKEVAIVNNTFKPQKVGTYKIVYKATDYYGAAATATVKVNVLAKDATEFFGDIVLPELLVGGFTYTIPQVTAKSCISGQVIDCEIKYFANGVELDEARTFVADGEKAQVTVLCRAVTKDGDVCGDLEKTVTVVNGDHGKNQTAYFYNGDGKVTITDNVESIDFTVSDSSDVEFANKLKPSAFALGVSYVLSETNFTSFQVILRDAENAGISVTLTFQILSEGVKIGVPHGKMSDFPSTDGYFKFDFDCESGIVYDGNGESVTFVEKDDAGNAFDGFSSGLYAKFSFVEVIVESKIGLSWLNNQKLGAANKFEEDKADQQGPEIVMAGELPIRVEVGEEIVLAPASAYDVFSQAEVVKVRVQAPSGENVFKETDATDTFRVKTTEVGDYRVFYTAYDSEGNRTRVGQTIQVLDASAPTLEVDYKDAEKSVGDTVKLPEILNVADDSEVVYYDIFLTLPSGEVRLLLHSANGEITSYLAKDNEVYTSSFKVSDTKFKVEEAGTYLITVMAYDDAYNVTMETFTLTVSEGGAQSNLTWLWITLTVVSVLAVAAAATVATILIIKKKKAAKPTESDKADEESGEDANDASDADSEV